MSLTFLLITLTTWYHTHLHYQHKDWVCLKPLENWRRLKWSFTYYAFYVFRLTQIISACASALMLAFVFSSFDSCSVTWEMEQTMTNMTGNIVDKPSPCLANQPVNMSDVVAYSLHSAAGHTKDQAEQIIWLCHWKPTHFVSVATVMHSQ